jgi:acetoacetate decarboxylase
MFLNDELPIADGRELWGYPRKLVRSTRSAGGRHVSALSTTRPPVLATASLHVVVSSETG